MKSYGVEYTSEASENITDLFEYVLDQSQNYTTATRYIDRLYEKCEAIGNAPFGGVARDDLSVGTRLAIFEKKVLILYSLLEDVIVITNVFHGAQDYLSLLRHGKSES
ncbi:type II toxin-antitoxin system RelE/ParE family toxin [Pararhizobium antarcticum]|uniref:Plasmid stabilization protein n=1 Tax=Pararhizobium antarcticum TaxID=1798805 RepID=A0A657LQZ5_9HYPH|nr:type II toxin-antitoxin system RelE/ParE family toxin [Pararhizobium antarcticum]OJF95852.1 hypothetical protein AX760_18630 [Pararhizobium antarcticum]OJF99295.1 hypothetical protein AX761_11265 [Rhizobium sp. 58]